MNINIKEKELHRVVEMLNNPAYLHITCVNSRWVNKHYGDIQGFLDALEQKGVTAHANDGKYIGSTRSEADGYYIITKSIVKGYGRGEQVTEPRFSFSRKKRRTLYTRPKSKSLHHGDREHGQSEEITVKPVKIKLKNPNAKKPRGHSGGRKSKPVVSLDINGNILKHFKDTFDAADYYDLAWATSVTKCIRKSVMSRKAKVFFRYEEDVNG